MRSENNRTEIHGKAESAFRAAFERLKINRPIRVPKGTIITQNNIAREAGVDPSALKKTRFPLLIEEIQCWLNLNKQQKPTSQRQQQISSRKKIQAIQKKLAVIKSQRDHALTLLASADMLIVDLSRENLRLKKQLPNATVTPLTPFIVREND